MLVLARYTRKMINLHDLPAVAKCMRLADKIYSKGNTIVKNAVENVFVYSFSGLRNCCDQQEWSKVQSGMPMTLYSLYVKQIYRSGFSSTLKGKHDNSIAYRRRPLMLRPLFQIDPLFRKDIKQQHQ